MKIFDLLKKSISTDSTEIKKRTLKKEDFNVAGVHYYENNIKKLACSNKDYRASAKTNISDGLVMKRIYQYDYINKPVKLVPEPKNPHDKNAIMVMIAGEKVGYISAEECAHVHYILNKCDIKFISSHITGGKYKVVSLDGDAEIIENHISITVRIGYAD